METKSMKERKNGMDMALEAKLNEICEMCDKLAASYDATGMFALDTKLPDAEMARTLAILKGFEYVPQRKTPITVSDVSPIARKKKRMEARIPARSGAV